MNYLFRKLDEFVSDRKSTKKELDKWINKLESSLTLLEDLEEARSLFQTASQITQSQLSINYGSISLVKKSNGWWII